MRCRLGAFRKVHRQVRILQLSEDRLQRREEFLPHLYRDKDTIYPTGNVWVGRA